MPNAHQQANRSRRLAAKIKQLITGAKTLDERIAAVTENDELSEEDKAQTISRLRQLVGSAHQQVNRLKGRQKELAYEDGRPNAAFARGQDGHHFPSYTEVLLDRGTKWTRLSRRECKCHRAFHTVSSCYGNR